MTSIAAKDSEWWQDMVIHHKGPKAFIITEYTEYLL